ncbi:MAG TPA: PQQ-dependent sugar dehydrogenase [Actinophytocola sp.]|uniref:PQQ-dependent sugar dehydrogenase n=1 Tax=Actinophytocola sp. TaxID=1872138 RepID=UPI002DDCA50E|nr:PQQ-dependent sugar dehydrogenase [Actinophytocola sp.]HEV2781461.1 PQQ-dependent sugar dehydrogenase [Actinophytocola sp.]
MSGCLRRLGIIAVTVGLVVVGPTATPASAAVPPGFTDSLAIGGLTNPTAAVFAPDGRVLIAEKSGIIKSYDSLADTTATVFADLRPQVYDFWDRGLLGLAVDPQFPADPYVYALYTYDALQWNDACPTPPGATGDGCLTYGRLSRLTMGAGGVSVGEQVLVTDWCQQYPSHSIGTVTFGPDGKLYLGGGDGASFNFTDYGQVGNPCGDPPSPAGVNLAPPDARGGALRSQSPRRPAGEPVTLDGTILRYDPDTGARSIIAYGMRNQFRFGFRPGTGELWVGDVGWSTWEEINRIPDATDAVVENFGWPCYEGTGRQPGYDGANLTMCESLYAAPTQVSPYYAYNHSAKVVPTDPCPTGGSAISGIAFENGTSNYPAAYTGALFFADASRGCIWAIPRGANGLPDTAAIVPFVTGVATPVQTLIGPGGDLFYVALGAGQLRRVQYPGGPNRPPDAVASATPTSGVAPLTVQFDGTRSTDPDADPLTYAWDLDADGAFDDSASAQPGFTYTQAGVVNAALRVTDPDGASDTATVPITVGASSDPNPVPVIDTPAAGLLWQVGQVVPFSGHATDGQDGALAASRLSWQLTLQHCTGPTNCHAHVVQSFPGVATGSFTAPDHEYPSYLDLTLTATDSDGNTASTTRRLDPRTVVLTFTSSPSGALLVVGGTSATAPFTRTVIVGSNNSISAPSPQVLGAQNRQYDFRKWSDGGAQTHNIIAPAGATTYQATFKQTR